jgi:hypothetical protein
MRHLCRRRWSELLAATTFEAMDADGDGLVRTEDALAALVRHTAGAYTCPLCSSTCSAFVTVILKPPSVSHRKCVMLSQNMDECNKSLAHGFGVGGAGGGCDGEAV